MASEWFYKISKKQVGPISSAELRNLAQSGTISIKTLISKNPNGPWVSAEHIKGLFTVSNATPPPVPVAGTAEMKPADSSNAPKRIISRS
jgi:hypothetical protein